MRISDWSSDVCSSDLARFREGLADPSCGPDTSERWQRHFAAAPKRLASSDDNVLPLFGYVVDALRDAHLPTEYALIPFVESGYKPGADRKSNRLNTSHSCASRLPAFP